MSPSPITLLPKRSRYQLAPWKPTLALALFLVMTGCVKTQPHESAYNDSLLPTQLPVGPVALIMSDSAIKAVRKMTHYNNYFKNSWAARVYVDAIREAYIATSDPDASSTGVTRILEKRFHEVRHFHSFEKASHSNVPLIAKLDISIELINNRSSQPASHLSLAFYTSDGTYLGTIASSANRILTPLWTNTKGEHEIVADIQQQGAVQRQALELLEQRLADIPIR